MQSDCDCIGGGRRGPALRGPIAARRGGDGRQGARAEGGARGARAGGARLGRPGEHSGRGARVRAHARPPHHPQGRVRRRRARHARHPPRAGASFFHCEPLIRVHRYTFALELMRSSKGVYCEHQTHELIGNLINTTLFSKQ